MVDCETMKSKVVAILESRTGEHLAELIERRGGIPMLAPALEETPDVDPQAIAGLMTHWRVEPFQFAIFQTGVGTKALFAATDAAAQTDEFLMLLERATVVVRGPKPVGELNARGVRIDIKAASPFTTQTVLDALEHSPLRGAAVLLQRYGAANRQMVEILHSRGATVHEIATYKWTLPSDLEPLNRLLEALHQRRIDAVLFTSAVQMHHLFEAATRVGRASTIATDLNATLVGSVGPVCTRALREYGVTPHFEADPPKLGPLLTALAAALP